MPSDLNAKKSWHPGALRNQAKVSQLEKNEIEERLRIAERQREIRAEKELDDLRRLQQPENPHSKLGWMYRDSKNVKPNSAEKDVYLSGQKPVTPEKLKANIEVRKSEWRARDDKLKSSQDPMMAVVSSQRVSKNQNRKKRDLKTAAARSSTNGNLPHCKS